MEDLIEKSQQGYGANRAMMWFTVVALGFFAAIPVTYYFGSFEAAVVTALMCGLIIFALK